MRRLLPLAFLTVLVACKADSDADGFKSDVDCDDANPAINPDAPELCNGVDDNCDGNTDPDDSVDVSTYYADADGDTFADAAAPVPGCAVPDGAVENDDDCDDTDANVKPGGVEVCNGVDDDCNGSIDPVTSSDAGTWYEDSDGDGYGDALVSEVACEAPAGYVDTDDDCDDLDGTTYPDAQEVCGDGYENDCNTDDVYDCDASECTGDAACVPSLVSITPNEVTEGKSVNVTVTGSGFDSITAGTPVVTFGTEGDCTNVVVLDDFRLTCDTPAGDAGTYDVTVTTGNGSETLSGAFTWKPLGMYAADGKSATSGSLYSIDVDTGTVTEIGKIGYAVTAMAFAPDGTLYAITAVQGSNAALLTIDTATGLGTKVADISGPSYESMPDMTFVGSRLVAWSESGDDPYEVDVTTGKATLIGSSSPGTAGSGLAYDGSALWLIPYGNTTLYKIDPSTGAATSTGVTMTNLVGSTFNSMTFMDGVMYVNDADRNGGDSVLSRVDTTTGKITAVATMSTYVDAIAAQN